MVDVKIILWIQQIVYKCPRRVSLAVVHMVVLRSSSISSLATNARGVLEIREMKTNKEHEQSFM